MTTSTTTTREDFTTGPLYKKLVEVLPAYVKNPFTDTPTLDVGKLITALGKSHEAIYKWLRSSRLTPKNAQQLVELANGPDNLKALSKLERPTPTREDFLTFVFSA